MEIAEKVAFSGWAMLAAMAPWLLLGFVLAGAMSVWLSPAWIERHLGGRGWRPVLLAAVFGIPLPLCSCGVLPVAAALRHSGASRGAVGAFLIATPQTGVDSLLITARLLSPAFAVFRVLAAFFSGVLGGLLINWFADEPPPGVASSPEALSGCHCSGSNGGGPGAARGGEEPADEDCCHAAVAPEARWRQALHYGLVTLVDDLALPLLAGILVAGLIEMALPEDWVGQWFGTGMGGRLLMLVLGLPMYICATGSVPVAAALLTKGASPGAALVFLMTGPATNAAGLTTQLKLLGVSATGLYLLAVAGSALLAGTVLDAIGYETQIRAAAACHPERLTLGEHLAAGMLLILLAAALVRRGVALIRTSGITAT